MNLSFHLISLPNNLFIPSHQYTITPEPEAGEVATSAIDARAFHRVLRENNPFLERMAHSSTATPANKLH